MTTGDLNSSTNIILTGFMATGKSTIGRLLARRLQRKFVDTDAVIEDRHGPIPDIFAQQGEAAFRAMEHEVARELSTCHQLVIATGGGLMLDPENAELLSATGTVFCLTATVNEIVNRVQAQQADDHLERPMLVGDPERNVRRLLAQRSKGYGQYQQLSTTGRASADIVDELLQMIGLTPA